jgi:general secretion pathway protein F
MPVFEYTALDKKGKNISGIIDADSAIAARQRLRATNNFPVSIKEIEDIPAKKESKGISLPGLLVRVRQRDVTMMTRQLATLVGAGFPLVSAIDALLPQMKSYAFNKVLARIKDSIVEGSSFANALGLYSDTFSPRWKSFWHSWLTSWKNSRN